MSEYFDCVKEYKNIYENAVYTEELLEKASSVLELGTAENQLRKAAETIVNKLIKEFSVECSEHTEFKEKIDLLYKLNIIDKDSKDNFHTMRMEGNPGSHAGDTMDTHSARNYYNRKRKQDETAFKCLYVECFRFANEYIKKTENHGVSYKANYNASDSYNKSQAVNEKPKNSSVTYGSAQNSSKFTDREEGINYSGTKFGCGVLSVILAAIIVIYIASKPGMGIEDIKDAVAASVILLLISYLINIIIGSVFDIYANKKALYSGTLRFGNNTLNLIAKGIEPLDNVEVTINGQIIEDDEIDGEVVEEIKLIRDDGETANCILKHDTEHGYKIKVYKYYEKHCPRFDIVINDQKVVEGEKINLNMLKNAEKLAQK